MEETRPEWFLGIDWGSTAHQLCLCDQAGTVRGERQVPHSGQGLEELCTWVRTVTQAEPARIAVGIEVPHGPVVEMLLERGFAVFAINPKQLDRFRDRFSVAGAKDDRRDARAAADALRTDPQCFRRLVVDAPAVIELREWSRMADDLQHERVRLMNRVREQLWRYYPQLLTLTDDLSAPWFLALWDLVPTPAAAATVRRAQLAALLARHRVRTPDATTVLARLRAPALTVAPGTVAAATARLAVLSAQLRLITAQLRTARARLDALVAAVLPPAPEEAAGQGREQRDEAILRSLPGVGRIVLATLLAEAAGPLQGRDYHALRGLSGVAPVTKQSGKRRVVLMRYACEPRLRTAVHHWAGGAMQWDPYWRAAYQALRGRGHSHARALRTIGDRLLATACAMLRNRTCYDPTRRRKAA